MTVIFGKALIPESNWNVKDFNRFRNRLMLGFAFRDRTANMSVGLSVTKPNNAWSWLNPTYNC